ncbi:uncharacterized protein PgNI_02468 [Pyricularia grisea]|uniref:Uncharacterized protein n=1 Tax=Pyricularia grisea TaxID=148305 RepID=A0A6P8BLR4_PYRGI|nr:uncharacterized protein PgNI_02468 [Pyricularia grisea]TLD17816.1 hypothetical protein PgNI_02468 [Pyricularia grisea]
MPIALDNKRRHDGKSGNLPISLFRCCLTWFQMPSLCGAFFSPSYLAMTLQTRHLLATINRISDCYEPK